nr:MAG TPA: hypothetical protein [Inoviridae sp.]
MLRQAASRQICCSKQNKIHSQRPSEMNFSDGLIYCVPSGAHILNSCKAP